MRAKSLDTFCPLGSELVQVDDPQSLKLTTRVNGELVQDSNTSEMIFGVAELISFCSHSFTLEAGDVILTGTPWGCGEFMDPKRSLQGRRRRRMRDRGGRRAAQPGGRGMKVHLPESVDEAVGLLGAGVLIAGGTHVMPRARARPSRWSACAAPGSRASSAKATRSRSARRRRWPQVGREVAFLHDAIESIASPTIRNLATVGGNLFVPQPHGDLAVCLLALDARVSIIDATARARSACSRPRAS